ncbi:MAG TPA: DUF1223 domain-containing protein [Bryobacteraceae bacterium]|jgi:hypothetical protein
MARTFAAALAVPAVLAGVAAAQTRTPVLVELFTSEACSSCPPADAVLTRLEREQPVGGVEVIGLGEHVDYWNETGWRDRFSSPLFTSRQQDYGQALRLANVYTPQMVINGRTEVVGSDETAVRKAIRAAAQGPAAMVALRVMGFDNASFQVRRLPEGVRTADILLAITESGVDSVVLGGENNGHRLHHSDVVRSLHSLGKLDTKKDGAYTAEARLNLRPDWKRENLKLVLFVQDRTTRRILGAAAARL